MNEIVLDTNVLVAALPSKRGVSFQILRLIGTRVFRSNISVALALEYKEVLKRTDLISALTEGDVDRLPDYVFQCSNLVPSVDSMRPTLPDLPEELYRQAREIAESQHLSVDDVGSSAFAEQSPLRRRSPTGSF